MLSAKLIANTRALAARHLMASRAPLSIPRSRGMATAEAQAEGAPKELTFTSYDIYKGKAAMQMKAIIPTWDQVQSQNNNLVWQVKREGVLLLEFASTAAGQGQQSNFGNRSYDWSNKVTFALKATELAQIADLEFNNGVSFTHDPEKGKEGAGAVMKTLSVKPSNSNDGSWMFYMNQTGPNKTAIAVPVTRAEYKTIQILANYLVPRLMGFDAVFDHAIHSTTA